MCLGAIEEVQPLLVALAAIAPQQDGRQALQILAHSPNRIHHPPDPHITPQTLHELCRSWHLKRCNRGDKERRRAKQGSHEPEFEAYTRRTPFVPDGGRGRLAPLHTHPRTHTSTEMLLPPLLMPLLRLLLRLGLQASYHCIVPANARACVM